MDYTYRTQNENNTLNIEISPNRNNLAQQLRCNSASNEHFIVFKWNEHTRDEYSDMDFETSADIEAEQHQISYLVYIEWMWLDFSKRNAALHRRMAINSQLALLMHFFRFLFHLLFALLEGKSWPTKKGDRNKWY